ncbi:MAG: Zn-ribbon domain-containing OB-fold protein, partial [Dehalococcoidia bacterium]
MGADEFSIASYNSYLAEHKLMASKCDLCESLSLPPRAVCPQCHGREISWRPLQGEGKVLGFTSIAIVP